MNQRTVSEIASLIQGTLIGDPSVKISGVSDLIKIRPGTLVFVFEEENWKIAAESPATAIVTGLNRSHSQKPVIVVKNPRLAQAKVLELFLIQEVLPDQRDWAYIHSSAKVASSAIISPFCYIGEGVEIGENTILYPNVYVGSYSKIGQDNKFLPGVVIRERSQIGNRVILEGGVVIGGDGFGYQKEEGKHVRVPQIGNVIIEDDVEIGANSTVDRATIGSTVIGQGTKIDNMVHIGHNCRLGKDCIIVAGTGISGSVEIGDRVTIAGQVGIISHICIGSDSTILGRSVVTKDVPPGSWVSGFPARPHREDLKTKALMKQLPEVLERLKHLEKKISGGKG